MALLVEYRSHLVESKALLVENRPPLVESSALLVELLQKSIRTYISAFSHRSLLQKSPTKETYILQRVIPCHLVCQIQYGMVAISRLLKIIGLFCRIQSLL